MSSLPFWALGAALIAAIVIYLRGRVDGAKLERTEQHEAEAKARDIADQVDNDVGAMPPDKRREELKRW
jgi:hypothetical protein